MKNPTLQSRVDNLNKILTVKGLPEVSKVTVNFQGESSYNGKDCQDFTNVALVAYWKGNIVVGMGSSKRNIIDQPCRSTGIRFAFERAKDQLIRHLLALKDKDEDSFGFLTKLRELRSVRKAVARANRLRTNTSSKPTIATPSEFLPGSVSLNGKTHHKAEELVHNDV